MMKRNDRLQFSGLTEGQIAPTVSEIVSDGNKSALIVTASFSKAKAISKNLSFFTSWDIYTISDEEPFFFQYEAKSHDQLEDKLRALIALSKGEKCIVVAPISAALKMMPPVETFKNNAIELKIGLDYEIDKLRKQLVNIGYEAVSMVENVGQFSYRGGIIDIYPVDFKMPCRIDFFDTQIESIKLFDVESQKSIEKIDGTTIYPAELMIVDDQIFAGAAERVAQVYDQQAKRVDGEKREAVVEKKNQLIEQIQEKTNLQQLENYIHYFYDEPQLFHDYFEDGSFLFLDDPDQLAGAISLAETEAQEDFEAILDKGSAAPEDFGAFPGKKVYDKLCKNSELIIFTPFRNPPKGIDRIEGNFHITAKQPTAIAGRMNILESEIKRYLKLGYDVTIVCSSENRIRSMRDFLETMELEGRVHLSKGELASGIELVEERKVYLWDGDIFSTPKKKRRKKAKTKDASPIKSFSDINKGDYVVHEHHGIGKFVAIEKLDIQGTQRDYLKIKYAGADVLYVPVEQLDIIQKYIGGGNASPKVSKLSSGEWKRTKEKAKRDIASMANELIELSAARKSKPGYAFSPDTVWQKDFEDRFPYDETPDQLRSIESIKRDMEQPVSMDRLLCGDVGYGKTEVAARAIFKCISDEKQAVILVPTTILANQHYITLKERIEEFPFEVEMLSRFRSAAEQRAIIEKLKAGMVDVVVGTHRLLSKDISFKDLGLLVIDEEQRFGVKDKEKIKSLKNTVDVLSLSATPIPRTLHMSLVGLKDMDLLEEPPEDRYPVQTYVMEENDEIIRETIRRELNREGQIYIVYNRVKGIERVATHVRELIPEARVVTAHGKMNETELENVMLDFVDNNYDVLISTTIIEAGIDIPNVNTILILDADKFGLSQLYQLRGRVGRTNRMAYAYLLYRRDKSLSEVAQQRLRAIKEFTEFGAGFRIAMKDLEIRGAGNLLGQEQHGHMMAIGYELYCKLVDDAVRALEGEAVSDEEREVIIELQTSAFISDNYIEDEVVKLQIYKKVAMIKDREDENEMFSELEDRFGTPPMEVKNLLYVARIKALANELGLHKIKEENDVFMFEYADEKLMNVEKVARAAEIFAEALRIKPTSKPRMYLNITKKQHLQEVLEFLESLVV